MFSAHDARSSVLLSISLYNQARYQIYYSVIRMVVIGLNPLHVGLLHCVSFGWGSTAQLMPRTKCS